MRVSTTVARFFPGSIKANADTPFHTGEAELEKDGIVVRGELAFCAEHVRMTYVLGPARAGDMAARQLSARPSVDHRHLRVPTSVSGVYANPVLVVDALTALECAAAADRDAAIKRTDHTALVGEASALLQSWMSSGDRALSSILYAHLERVFEPLFGLDFYQLQRVPLAPLLAYYRRLLAEGIHVAFAPVQLSATMPDPNTADKRRGRRVSEDDEDAPVMTIEREEDAYLASTSSAANGMRDDAADDTAVTLRLPLERAITLLRAQPGAGTAAGTAAGPEEGGEGDEDDEEEEEEDEEEEEAAERGELDAKQGQAVASGLAYLAKKQSAAERRSRHAPPGAKLSTAEARSKFALKSADRRITYLSTNSRLTRLPLPDMAHISQDGWITGALVEFLIETYGSDGHMCVSQTMLREFSEIMNNYGDFPVLVSIEDTWRAILGCARRGEPDMVVVDTDTAEIVRGAALGDLDPESAAEAGELKVALPFAVKHEAELARALGRYLAMACAREADMRRWIAQMPSKEASLLVLDDPPKRTMSDEQWDALRWAQVAPLTFIHGSGGTGKSTWLRMFVRILRRRGSLAVPPDAPTNEVGAIVVAFKNDTANQAQASLRDVWGRYNRADAVHDGGTPDEFAKACVFRTCDSTILQYFMAPPAGKLRARHLIIDEASMLGAAHFYRLLNCFDLSVLEGIVIAGDPLQIPPILPGNPFPILIEAFPQASFRFRKVFRTDNTTLHNNVEAVRNGELEALELVPAERMEPDTVAGFIDLDSPLHYKSPVYMADIITNVQGILRMVDPDKTRYREIGIMAPFNEPVREIAAAVDAYYFPGARPGSFSVGQRIIFKRTDKRRKIARGRIGIITDIRDHFGNYRPGVGHAAKNTSQPSSANRTIIIDDELPVTFYGAMRPWSLLESGSCFTVHRSQGSEFGIAVCVFPNSPNLANRRIAYTAISRAKKACYIISDHAHFVKMIQTPPPECESILSASLARYAPAAPLDRVAGLCASSPEEIADAAPPPGNDDVYADDACADAALSALLDRFDNPGTQCPAPLPPLPPSPPPVLLALPPAPGNDDVYADDASADAALKVLLDRVDNPGTQGPAPPSSRVAETPVFDEDMDDASEDYQAAD